MVALLVKHEVAHKKVADLTSQEFWQCYRLNFRHNGCMQSELYRQKKFPRTYGFQAEIFGIWENDSLVSWALVFGSSQNPSVYFYTRVAYRQKGYGRAIANAIARVHPQTRTYPHDATSREFFGKVTVYVG